MTSYTIPSEAGLDAKLTANAAADRARGNHTGTQSADTITDGTTNKAYTATERTKLASVAAGATVNRTDSSTDALLATKADLVGGFVPTAQLPSISLENSVVVANRAAMLALTTTQVQPGDIAVDTSTGATRGSYILTATDPSQFANWLLLNAPLDAVQTVNGQSGTVVLAKADVGLGSVDNTSDTGKPVSTAQQAALDAKAPLASPAFTGTPAKAGTPLATTSDITTAVAGLAKPINLADSPATNVSIPRWVSTPWQPWTKPYQTEPDTLFCPGAWATENDFLAAGGRLAFAWDTYYSAGTVKATVAAGKYGAPLVTGNAAGAYAVIPLDGILSLDKFTIETSIVSVGADFTAQTFAAAYTFLAFDGTGAQNEGLFLRRTSATTLAAVLTNASATITASLTIASGDIPSNTETGVAITYDGTTLTLILGNNTKSATIGGSITYGSIGSADYWIGGLLINPGTGGTALGTAGTPSNVWQVAVPHIRRYPRTVGAQTVASAPGVLIDATIPGLTWPNNLTGVFSQYYGWKNTFPDGANGLGTSIRDAAIAAAGAAGAGYVRIDHIFDKVTIGGTTTSPTITDWSSLDVPMDKWVAANPNVAFHITFDYTPTLFGATNQTPPTDSNGYASLCVQAVAHWLAKGYKLASFALWNEPGNGTFWSGTSANMATLWAAIAGALNTAYGANSLVPKLGTTDGATTADMQAATITQATSSGLPMGSYHFHDYSGQPRNIRTNIATAKTQLAAGPTPGAGVYVTEWSDNQNVLAQIYTTPNSLSTRVPDRVWKTRHAALVHAMIQEMYTAGAVGATFTRLGILDDAFTGIERNLGLFSADSPPRPLPAFAAMSMLWKLNGAVVPTSPTSPALRATATWDATGQKLTAVVSSYAPARIGQPATTVALQWMSLPPAYTWKMWRFTDSDLSDGRPKLVSAGDQTNLPQGVELGACGLYCIQITSPTALTAFTAETAASWAMNLDPANIAGAADGAAVASWPDTGTAGVALVQATGTAQPIYKTSVVNGKPVVRFNSANSQTLVGSYGSDPLGTGAYTLVAVLNDSNSDGVFTQFRASGSGTPIKGYLRGANIRTIQRNDANTLISPTSPVTNNGVWEVVSLVWDGTTLTFRVNGKVITSTGSTGTITTNRFYIGSDNGSGTYLSGDVAKVLATGSALDATTLHHIEQSLGVRYGITIS